MVWVRLDLKLARRENDFSFGLAIVVRDQRVFVYGGHWRMVICSELLILWTWRTCCSHHWCSHYLHDWKRTSGTNIEKNNQQVEKKKSRVQLTLVDKWYNIMARRKAFIHSFRLFVGTFVLPFIWRQNGQHLYVYQMKIKQQLQLSPVWMSTNYDNWGIWQLPEKFVVRIFFFQMQT